GYAATYSPDDARTCRVIARTVRGLYFLQFGARLPNTHGVAVYLLAGLNLSAKETDEVRLLSKIAIEGKSLGVHREVFVYAVNRVPDAAHVTVWTMMFYGGTGVLCFTQPRAAYKDDARPLL